MPPQAGLQDASWEDIIAAAAKASGVNPTLALAVARRESSLNPNAVGDSGQAIGMFQLHPGAATDTGTADRSNPIQNIQGGVKYLKQLSDRYQGDLTKTLAAYNGGPDAVDKGTVSPQAQTYATEVLASLTAPPAAGGREPSRGKKILTMADRPKDWNASDDSRFKPWYETVSKQFNLDPNPDSPLHHYNYRYAFKTGAWPDDQGHWPSDFKDESHPNRFVQGRDTAGVEDTSVASTPAPTKSSFIDQKSAQYGVKLDEPTSAARHVIRATGPMTGAAVGAAEGASMGAPAGPLGMAIGGIAGAGAGAVGGEAISQGVEWLAEKFGLIKPSARQETIQQRAEQLGSAANTGMMAEVLGQAGFQVLTPVAKFVMGPMRSKLSAYAREALAMFPPKAKTTPAILPAEISESRGLNLAENIAEGSIFGGGKVARVKANRAALAQQKAGEVAETLGSRPGVGVREAGETSRSEIAQAVKDFRTSEKAAWEPFDQQAAAIPVATPKLDAFIAEARGAEAGAILPNAGATAAQRVAQLAEGDATGTVMVGGRPTPIRQLPASVQDALSEAGGDVGTAAEPLSAAQFSKTVRDLGKLVSGLTRAAKSDPVKFNAQLGLAKKLSGLAKDDLKAALQGTDALALYETAKGVSREGNKRLFNAAVRKVTNDAPEKMVNTLLRKNNSTAITDVLKAVGTNGREQLQRTAMEQIVQANPRTNQVDWAGVATRLQQLGDDSLSAMFPAGQAEDLKKLSALMVNLARKPISNIGRVGIMLTQFGALAGVATGTLTGTSAGLLLTPPLIAKIMASPTGLKWLTIGLQSPAGSEAAIKAAVQLTAFLRREQQQQPTTGYRTTVERRQPPTKPAPSAPR